MSQEQLISQAAELHDAGRFADAEAAYRQLLADRPGDTAVVISLADVLVDAGRIDEAELLYKQVLETSPAAASSAGAYDGLAAIAQDRGDLNTAVPFSKKAAELRGNADDAYAVAMVLENLGRGDDAMDMFKLAAELRPEFAEAHHKLAGHLRIRGKTADSIRHYQRSVEAQPTVAEFHCNLANALRLAGDEDAALVSARKAIELKPELAEAHNVLGAIWKDRRRPSDALGSFQKAIQLKPEYGEAINNMACVIEQAGRIDDAAAMYEQAVRSKPEVPEFHVNLGLNLLLRGDFARGWHEADWRRRDPSNPASRPFPKPIWDGSPLNGRTILLHAEQGLGDTMQFIRYAGLVRDRGGRVVVECQPLLTELLKDVDGVDQVVTLGPALPEFDVHCPLMSLPIVFRTDLNSIPTPGNYLKAEPEKVAAWSQRLAGVSGKRVGLVWAGSATFRNDKIRSIPPAKLLPLAAVPGISLVSLQKGGPAAPEQLNLIDKTAELTDFTETAALIANLDLVISVDTAVAHLAAAMGKPTWIMLPAVPDWRWMLGRDDSPWYPSARLFRQDTSGSWTNVIERLANALAEL